MRLREAAHAIRLVVLILPSLVLQRSATRTADEVLRMPALAHCLQDRPDDLIIAPRASESRGRVVSAVRSVVMTSISANTERCCTLCALEAKLSPRTRTER